MNDCLKRLEKIDMSSTRKWLKEIHLFRSKQWGGHVDGRGCRELFQTLDILRKHANSRLRNMRAIDEIANRDIEYAVSEVLQIADALEAFRKVMDDCFGNHLANSYKESIATFRRKYEPLMISVKPTPKAHVIFEHVAQYCEREKRGLGLTAEQAHETLHSFFKKAHAKHFVKCKQNPNFGPLLLQSVLEFNSMNCVPIE
jgi:hypothetical protein